MYWALIKQWFARQHVRLWQAALMRSGVTMVLGVTVLVLGLAFGWHEHRLGQFAQLKQQLKLKPPAPAPTSQPGGQDPIVLQRSPLSGDTDPEFLSMTLLPGRGMNILQITASVPGKGEVSLLAAPSLAEASRQMSGIGEDASGGASLTAGAPIEVPWAGGLSGAATIDGKNLTTAWRGRHLTLPMLDATGMSVGGLMLRRASDSQNTNVMPDGGEAQATFSAGDFDGHWISHTDISTNFELSSRAIEMTVQARNSGAEPEPVGIGWRPRFAIVSGNRSQEVLRMPMSERAEIQDSRTGMPTGRTLPVTGTPYDFTGQSGAQLGSLNLEESFVHLHHGFMDRAPVVELRDPAENYGIRISMLSTNIRAINVHAPAGANFVTIDPQTNMVDPFGHEWDKEEDPPITILQPGQSIQWKIRLEIFSLSGGSHVL